jgi:ATP-dependent helicase/nuclease subunit A
MSHGGWPRSSGWSRTARAGSKGSVAPGLHAPRAGAHEVVWWDPASLELDRKEEVGLRQQRILEADEEGVMADESIRDHEQWQQRRSDALEAGERPSIVVRSVTELAHTEAPERTGDTVGPLARRGDGDATEVAHDADVPVEVARVSVDRTGRPSGKRFGTLVHATLAVVDLDADNDRVHAAAVAEGRLLGSSTREIEAAVATARAALAHPLLRRAAAADQLRRETPVSFVREDGVLVEGIVDLAFRELAGPTPHWTVVDFKTDRDIEPKLSNYSVQLRLYAAAISRATAEPTEPILLSL